MPGSNDYSQAPANLSRNVATPPAAPSPDQASGAGADSGSGAGRGLSGLGVFGNIAQLLSIPIQYWFNQRAYKQQVKDNIAQWHRENAYNTPSAMMERFKDAGLNPDLIYGQQNESGHMQVAPEAAASPNVSGVASSIQASLQQREMMDAQIDLMKSEAEKNRSDVQHNEGDLSLRGQEIDAIVENYKHEWEHLKHKMNLDDSLSRLYDQNVKESIERTQTYAQQIAESLSRVDLNDAHKNLYEKQKELYQKDIDWFDRKMNGQLSLWASQANMNKQQALVFKENAKFLAQSFVIRLDNLIKEGDLTFKQGQMTDEQIKKVTAEISKIMNESSAKLFDAYYGQLATGNLEDPSFMESISQPSAFFFSFLRWLVGGSLGGLFKG